MDIEIDNIYLSIVVTFYNEEDVVKLFNDKLVQALSAIEKPLEIIYVDDGSTDNTFTILKEIVDYSKLPIALIKFRKNFGQTAGIQAGFDHAKGDIIIAMDGDLQHDPAEIPFFIEKIEEGYDLVSGWRKERVDNFWVRRLPSLMANKLMSFLSNINIHDFGTTFKAYKKEIIQNINLYGEQHRFIPVLAAQMGASICEIPIKNIERPLGQSKYGLSRTTKVFFDILTLAFFLTYSARPMHFWGRVGMSFLSLGFLMLLSIVFAYINYGTDFRGTLQIAIMLIILGFQILVSGFIFEFLSRIHYETTNKKIYNILKIYKKDLG